MYLGRSRRYYRGTEQACGRAPFLIVVTTDIPDGTALGKRAPLRVFVRQVALHQCGHFMMGRARIGKRTFSLSGTYGNDGLPLTVDAETYARGTPVPPELEAVFWKGGGHNDAGSEAWAMRAFGRELAGLPAEGRWHVVTSTGGVVLGVFGEALLSEAQECARRAGQATGLPAFVNQIDGARPHVGDVLARFMRPVPLEGSHG